jgi:transcriptional antiterminator RfaH
MGDWYAIHTKARQEYVAVENLERQSFEVFLPLIRQSRRRRGRWQTVTEPLFPGYLFSRLDLEADNIAPIRSTRGVTGLVRFGGLPCPVPVDVVEDLQNLQESEEGVICTATLFQQGDRVSICEGPLAGLEGIFLAASGKERVSLLLDFLGKQQRIDISRHRIAPAG